MLGCGHTIGLIGQQRTVAGTLGSAFAFSKDSTCKTTSDMVPTDEKPTCAAMSRGKPGLSKMNLGMYSWIERHEARPLEIGRRSAAGWLAVLPAAAGRRLAVSDRNQNLVGSEKKSHIGSESTIQFFEGVGIDPNGFESIRIAHSEHNPPAHRCTCGVRAQWGPVTDRTWAVGNLRKKIAPSEHFPQIANLQWSVCLSPCRSIREYTPRFLLNLGIHSEVLLRSSLHMRGWRRWGPYPPLTPLGRGIFDLLRSDFGKKC